MKKLYKVSVRFETNHIDVVNMSHIQPKYSMNTYDDSNPNGIGIEIYFIESESEGSAIMIALGKFNEAYQLYIENIFDVKTTLDFIVEMNKIISK